MKEEVGLVLQIVEAEEEEKEVKEEEDAEVINALDEQVEEVA